MSPGVSLQLAINRQLMRLPHGASCARCGETCVLALMPSAVPGAVVRCYACTVRRWEDHHLGGRYEGALVVRVPGNQHRVLSVLQHIGWRGEHEPGSPYAVAFDRAALTGVRIAWPTH